MPSRASTPRPGWCGFVARAAAALSLALAAAFAAPAAAQDLPGPPANLELIPAGSLVIPMDNAHQTLTAPFTIKAYGLANDLLQHKIPVKWAIRAGKAKDGIDFSVTAARIAPTAIAASAQDFRAGPFIVHKAYASLALARIAAFGGNVVVYQTTQDVTVDVRYTLTFKPLVAVNATNAAIHTDILTRAAIPNYTVISDFNLLAASCYTLASEPHNTLLTGITAIHDFVLSGGNFFAQCASVETYENNTPGGYISTAGIVVSNLNNAIAYPNPDLSFSQYEGILEPKPGGSVMDWKLGVGGTLKPNAHVHADNSGASPATYAANAQKLYFGGPGGMVFYLGGHQWGNGSLAASNGERMFLNAVMTPPTRPSSCYLGFGIPDIAITKAHSGTFYAGGNNTYTITATNVGNDSTFSAVTVKDTLPAGLGYVSATGTGWTFSVSGQIVTATYAGIMAPAAARPFTLTVSVGTTAAPGVTNRATGATVGDVNATNDVASDPTTVVIPVDLAIQKRHAANFTDRSNGTYTLVVRNVGPFVTQAATTVRDTLPVGLTYGSATGTGWTFSVSGQVVTASFAGTIAVGDSATFTLTAAAGAAAVPIVTNAATVSTVNDTGAVNNRSTDPTTVNGVVDVSLQKRHTADFSGVAPGIYTLVARNVGSKATTGTITVVDTLPTGLSYSSGSGTGWSFSTSGQIVTATHPGPIAPADSLAFTLAVAVSAPAVPAVTNSAVVSTAGDVDGSNDRATDPTVVKGIPDLAMGKRHSGTFTVGQNGTYTLTVANISAGPTAGAITVRDTLPAGLGFVAAAGAGWSFSTSGQIVTATNPGPIAANDSSVFTMTVSVSAAASPSVTNSATTATLGDLYPANDRASDPTVVSTPDLALDKRHTATFTVGQNGVYTLMARNTGTAATSGAITVTDTLPTGLGYVSAAGAGWSFSTSGQVVTASLAAALAAGDSAKFTLTASVAAAAFPSVTNPAVVATANDLNASNNRDTDPTAVTGVPDLAMDKRHTAAFTVGQNGVYTLVVRNTGTAATTGAITVVDTLPTGLGYVSAAGAGWSFSTSGQVVTASFAAALAAGDSAKFTLATSVAAAAFPSVTNAANATTAGDLDPSNNRDTDPTGITGVPDLMMHKRHTAAFTVGQNGTYTLVAHNTGTATTTGAITVTDTLPTGLGYVSAGGTGWSFSTTGQVVTASFAAALAPGDSAKFTLTASVGAAAFPSVTNAANAATAGDPDPSNDRVSDPTAITGVPDLAMDKRHTASFTVGQNGVYTLVVRNTGTAATSGAITVVDTLPTGLGYVSAAGAGWSFSTSGQVVTASFAAALAAGDSAKFTLTASVAAAAFPSVTNAANATTAGDLDPSNNRGTDPTAITGVPDLTLDKRHTTAFTVGQNGVYTLVVRNTGTAATSGAITVTDSLPTGLGYVSAAGPGWSFSTSGSVVTANYAAALAAGDSARFTLTTSVAATAFPSVTNAAVASTPGDLDPSNNRDTDPTAVTGVPDLAMDKRHAAAFTVGQNGTYTLVVRNTGTAATTGAITVTDSLPTGLGYVSASGAGWSFSTSGQVVTASFAAALAAGDSAKFTLTTLPSAAAIPSLTNAATAATTGDPDPVNDRDTDPTTVNGTVDLDLLKRHTGLFEVGTNDSYTLVVTNVGIGPYAAGITVRDTLPTGLTYVTASGPGWTFSTSGQVVTASFAAALAAGDSATFALTTSVAFAAFPATVNAAVVSGAGDVNPMNDRAVDSTQVHAKPDLTLDKRHTVQFVDGQNGSWKFVVTNVSTGPTTATATVTDTLPGGITFVSGSGAGWSFATSGSIVTATFPGVLSPGDSTSFTLTVNVGPAAVPLVTNAATLTGAGDLDLANNRDTDPTPVTGVPDLALDKRHPAAFTVGQNGTYLLVVRNTGSAAMAGPVTVRDTLPAGLSYVTASGAGFSFATSGPIVTATYVAAIPAGDSVSFTLTASVAAAAFPTVTNAATVSAAGDLDPSNDRDSDPTAITGVPDLALDKRHTAAFTVGQNGTYTLVVRNLGTAAASGATTVSDSLPTGLTYVSAVGAGWTFVTSGPLVTATYAAAIAAGDSARCSLVTAVGAAAVPSVTNAATATTPGDLDPANNRDTDPTAITGVPDLALDKRHAAPFVVGQTGTFTFVIRNLGSAASSSVTVSDTLPAGLTFASGTGPGWSFSASGAIVTATLPTGIATGDSATCTLDVNVAPAAYPSVTNSATARTALELDPSNDRDSDPTAISGVPDLALDKRHTAAFTVGQNGLYTMVVTNLGTAATSGATTVTDVLPAGLTYVSATGTGFTFAIGGQTLTATFAGAIAAGDSALFTLTASVGPAAFPSVTNTAVASTPGDLDPANNGDSDPTATGGAPDLALDKRHTAAFTVGQNGAYTVVARNLGTGATSGATTVRDTLPAGLTFVSGSGAGWSFATSGPVVTATHAAAIAAGDSAGFTLTASVAALAFPSVTNAATASTAGDVDPSNDRDSDPTAITGVPDLSLDKRHAGAITVGQNGTYTLVVRNLGTTVTTGATTVTDTLPAGLSYVTASGAGWSFATSGPIVTATYVAAIPAGDSVSFTLTTSVAAAAFPTVTNAATVSAAGDLDPSNDRDSDPTAITGVPDLALDKRHTAAFTVGQNGTYTLVVRNLGTAATSGATTVSDSLPTGLTYVSAAGAGWTFATSGPLVTATYAAAIAAGDSARYSLVTAVGAAAFPAITNEARVSTVGDLDPANDQDSDPTDIAGVGDIALDKRHTGAFTVGQNGTYTLVIRNTGTAATAGVTTVRDTLPAGLTYLSASGAGFVFALSGQVVTATFAGAIPAGDSASFALSVAVSAAAYPSVTNAATASLAGDLTPGDNRDSDPTAVAGIPDLALDKRHTAPFIVGQNATYTLVIRNTGTAATAAATAVTDTLPAGLTYVSASGAGFGFAVSGQVVTATYGAGLAAGDSASFTLTVAVGASAFPAVTNAATVDLPGDPTPADNRDSDAAPIVGVPDVTLAKRHTASLAVGQSATYTLVVTNRGTAATTGVTTVRDTLPAGLTYVSGSGPGWGIALSGPIVTATYAGSIAPDDSAAFTLTVAVGAAAYPAVTNAATASAAGDADPSNDRATDPGAVTGAPDLALDKRHSADFVDGQPGTWSFVVTNVGTSATIAATTVIDTLPAGIGFVSGSGPGWSLSAVGQIVTATHVGAIAPSDSALFDLTVSVSATAIPGVTNSAVAGTSGDVDPSNDRDLDPTIVNGADDVALAKRHTGRFEVGSTDTYTLVVTNVGSTSLAAGITVSDTLPAGLAFVSASGAGFSFASSGQVLIATSSVPLAVGDSLTFTLTVNVGGAAFPLVTNTAAVVAVGDANPVNDRAMDPTTVHALPDLVLDKRHTSTFLQGQPGSWTFVVTNPSNGPSVGIFTVTDTLPAGVGFVMGLGAGWSFASSGSIVTATYAAPVAPLDSTTFTLIVSLGAAAVPSVVNSATLAGGGDNDLSNNRDVDVASVTGIPDLALEKRHVTPFQVGQNGTYEIVATNIGTASIAGPVVVRDTLRAGLSFVTASGAGWTFSVSGAVVAATHATSIAAGDSADFALVVAVSAAAVPSVVNAATLTAAGDTDATNDADADTAAVLGVPDLAIDKRHTAPFTVGQNAAYELVVRNIGSAGSGSVAVTDTLPAGLGFVSASGPGWAVGASGSIITGTFAAGLAPGDSARFTIAVSVGLAALPSITNSAGVATAGEIDLSDNRDSDPTAVTGVPDVALDKRHAADFVDGANGSYTLAVTNVGSLGTAGATTVVDTLPAGLTFIAGSGAGWSFAASGQIVTATHPGSIAVGDSAVCALSVAVGTAAVPGLVNAAIANTPGDADGANDRDTDPTVVNGFVDLALDKRHTTPFAAGQNGVYQFVVTNVGSSAFTGVTTVRDTLPAGLTFVSGAGAGWSITASGAVVTATWGGSIAVGDSASFSATVAIGPAAVPGVVNAATATGAGDVNAANDRDADPTTVTGTVDLVLDKRHTAAFVDRQGGTYTFVVRNGGTMPTTGATTVVDTLPAGLAYVSANGSGFAFAISGQVVTATYAGAIPAGDSASFTLAVAVGAAALPSVINRASVTSAGDVDASNDADADTAAVAGVVDLALDKRHTTAFAQGTPASWSFVLTNVGSRATTGAITVSDTLPAGIAFSAAAGSGWSVTASGVVVTATHAGPIAAGDSASFTITVDAGAAAVPGVINAATALTAGDVDPSNDRDSDPTAVGPSPDLALDKRHAAPFVVGQAGTYTLVVTNLGTAATTGAATVTDSLPAGLGFVSGAGAGWSFAASGSVVTATYAAAIAAGDSASFTLDVSVAPTALGGVVNGATVTTANDFDPANDRDSDTTAVAGVPDLALDKRHVAGFTTGVAGTYTLVVTNLGTAATTGAATVTDSLPAGLGFVSGAGVGWSFAASGSVVTATYAAAIAAGDSARFTLDVSVAPAALGGVVNLARVSAAGDTDAANDGDADTTAVGGALDLGLDKRHTGSFTVGGTGTYVLAVTNLGTVATSGAVTVRDTLPAGLGFVAASGAGWSFATAGQIVTATFGGAIAAGDSATFTLDASVGPTAFPAVTNAAQVSTPGDLDPANDRDSDPAAVAGVADLMIDKRHVAPFIVGANGVYTIVVTNVGTAATTGAITVTDSLPAGLTYVAAAGATLSFTNAGQIVTASLSGTLAPGDSIRFDLTVSVSPGAIPSVDNAAVVTSPGILGLARTRDVDPTAVTALPDLELVKRHLGTFMVGGTGTYTIMVRNQGTGATTGAITVRDTLPAGLAFISGGNADWTLTSAGSVVTATRAASLVSGDSSGYAFAVAIGPAAYPAVTNAATASTAGDPPGANDRDTDAAPVGGLGQLTIEKTASTRQAEIGDVVDYSVTVRNVGTAPVANITVADALPQGLRYQAGTARLNGAPVADPAGAPGPGLTFTVGSVAPAASAALTYRVVIGAGAELGTGTNSATAAGDGPGGPLSLRSNTAAATIEVRGGVFGDEAIIAGKVYTECDCDSNRVQGPEELGIPGVRLYLEDGAFAITDVEGKYHFNHVRPRLHVVRIDRSTLPAGARMVPHSTRFAGDGLSQFVDPVKGELHRADFIEASHDDGVRASIQARRARGEVADAREPGAGDDGAALTTPARRPSLLVLGVIDAGLGMGSLRDSERRGRRDGFFDSRDDFSAHADDGRLLAGARGAVFAQGPIADRVFLTLRYDTGRDPQRRLFRDLQPFEGYDVIGDASVHGWDAQSASRLYLRVERGNSSAMFGDFTTPGTPERALGAFTRSLNGGLAQVTRGPLAWNGWASEGRQHQVVDEFPGQGVSGPYALRRSDGTLGSETVEILTRDRNQPARILRREARVRFVDYTLEPFTGRLIFRAPVPSVDADLNPVSIRATYEVESGADRFWVYGTEAQWCPLTRLTIGAAAARDEDPLAPRSVASAHGMLTLREGVTLAAEFARSDSGGPIGSGDLSGTAGRLEMGVQGPRFSGRAYALRVDTGFDNPSAGVVPGREELGVSGRAPIAGAASAFLTALRSKDLASGGHRDGLEAGLARTFAERWTTEAAYRWAREENVAASPVTAPVLPIDVSSIRGKLTASLPTRWKPSVFGEVEQDLAVAEQRRYGLGGEAHVAERTRLYLRHENIASFAGPFALNTQQQQATTVVGLASDGTGDGHVFSEYRVRDAFAGRETQAAIGLRDRWQVRPGVRIDGAFERVTVLRGGEGDATALAGGIEYLREPLWRATARLEFRTQSSVEHWLGSAGLARKLNRDWAALGRTTWLSVPDEARIDARTQLGVAYRPTDGNVWNALARWENRLEKAGGTDSYRRMVNILSAHGNAQPARPWTFSGQLAAKWAGDDRQTIASRTVSQLVAGRALYDLGTRTDLGLTARGLRSGGTELGLGAEFGWLATRNLRLAAGYNVFGFRDADLAGTDRTDRGPYLGFGFKFDESWFDPGAREGAPR